MPVEANQLAVANLRAKTPVGSVLNTAEWGDVPLALRDRAFFSAEVEKLRLLQRMQDRLQGAVELLRRPGEGKDGGEGAYQTREKFVAEMQKLARDEGLDPRNRDATAGRAGTIRDITSERRLKLIYDVQTESAAEYARWKAEQDPAVMAAFPAQEFVRIKSVKKPRVDWDERWQKAGGKVINGRKVALKSDPVWRQLSRFGTPWPPFDFGSGMGLRDVRRKEAEALGLIKPGEPVQTDGKTAEEGFNDALQASVADLNPEYRRLLQQTFGEQIEFDGDTARWKSAAPPVPATPTPPPAPPPPAPAPAEAAAMQPALAQLRTALRADLAPLQAQLATATQSGTFAEQVALRMQIAGRQQQAVTAGRQVVQLPAAERGAITFTGAINPALRQATQQGAEIATAYTAPALLPSVAVKKIRRGGRASYSPSRVINIAETTSASVIAHELTHGTEMQNPALLAKAKAFLQSRTRPGEQAKSLKTLTGNAGYRSSERTIEDEWVTRGGHHYTGKLYPNATEILTMGIERLHADPALFAEQDPEFFSFVVNTLRGL